MDLAGREAPGGYGLRTTRPLACPQGELQPCFFCLSGKQNLCQSQTPCKRSVELRVLKGRSRSGVLDLSLTKGLKVEFCLP